MLTREEFEDWLEDHRSEALDRIEAMEMPLARWVALYSKALAIEVRDNTDSDEEDVVEEELDAMGIDDPGEMED